MRACIQRVSRARAAVESRVCGAIDKGLLVLLGVVRGDTDHDTRKLADKIATLRIFEDEQGKMNLDVSQSGGRMLVVSQFTLMADCRKGRRPSFTGAAGPEEAQRLYQVFTEAVVAHGVGVATGQFQQHMQVELVNDGPVTILLDSTDLTRPRK